MLSFPEQPEIPLKNAPISSVICQLRFPTVLKIATEQPVELQEEIRNDFPSLEVEGINPLADSPSERPVPANFRFKTADESYLFSLAPNFFSLSTEIYTHWKDFSHLVSRVADVVIGIYKIPYATRLGLRYTNKFDLENTQSSSLTDLKRVFRPELTAQWQTDCWDKPEEVLNQIALTTEEKEHLTIRLAVINQETSILDFDYFNTGKIPLDGLKDLLNHYHGVIYNAFRWSIMPDELKLFGVEQK